MSQTELKGNPTIDATPEQTLPPAGPESASKPEISAESVSIWVDVLKLLSGFVWKQLNPPTAIGVIVTAFVASMLLMTAAICGYSAHEVDQTSEFTKLDKRIAELEQFQSEELQRRQWDLLAKEQLLQNSTVAIQQERQALAQERAELLRLKEALAKPKP